MQQRIATLTGLMAVAFIGSSVGTALGQAVQFRDQTNQRFPQPGPLEWTNQVSLADINGNGSLDIAFANGGNFAAPGVPQLVRIYMNDGAGFFTDETMARTGGLTGHFRHVEFGDVNLNGHLDMALANDFNALPRLLMNDGDGFFTDETTDRLPSITMSATRVQFFDVNNNGNLDLYITNGGTTNRFGCAQNRIYQNDGNGFFTDVTAQRHPAVIGCGPMDAKIGDLTGDFWLDVRVAGLGNNNSKLYYNAGGVLENVSGNVPNDSNGYSYDFGDINGNGRLDMIGVNCGPGLTKALFGNNGTGTFSNISSQLMPNPNVDDNDSKFFDFNNNGHLDLIIARLGGVSERIYENDGNGNFTQVFDLISPVTDSTLDVVVGDLTGDGRLDIVTGQGESGVFLNRIYINSGPEDTIPPTIVRTEELEDTDETDGPYVIRAAITDGMTSDRNFFDNGIYLHYTVNGGEEQIVTMRWSGGQIYRGEIPGQAGGGTIEYFVRAIDFNDNVGFGETRSFVVSSDAIVGDLDGNGVVDVFDLLILLDSWGACRAGSLCPADLNDDGTVDVFDMLILLENWGSP